MDEQGRGQRFSGCREPLKDLHERQPLQLGDHAEERLPEGAQALTKHVANALAGELAQRIDRCLTHDEEWDQPPPKGLGGRGVQEHLSHRLEDGSTETFSDRLTDDIAETIVHFAGDEHVGDEVEVQLAAEELLRLVDELQLLQHVVDLLTVADREQQNQQDGQYPLKQLGLCVRFAAQLLPVLPSGAQLAELNDPSHPVERLATRRRKAGDFVECKNGDRRVSHANRG